MVTILRQVHINGGTIHKHGPRHDPCPGSNMPPLQARSQTQAPADQPVSMASAKHATPNDVTGSADSSVYTAVPDHCRRFSAIWSPADNALGPINLFATRLFAAKGFQTIAPYKTLRAEGLRGSLI